MDKKQPIDIEDMDAETLAFYIEETEEYLELAREEIEYNNALLASSKEAVQGFQKSLSKEEDEDFAKELRDGIVSSQELQADLLERNSNLEEAAKEFTDILSNLRK